MAVLLVLGTRPEIIKLGPLARELSTRGIESTVVHTGQHFDPDMSDSFLQTFGMEVGHRFECGGLSRGAQIGRMTEQLTALFEKQRPEMVVVQGDTNSALAGALAANSVGCPLLHVEAGLRSFDRRMPEEHNRILIDALADLCAAPTETSAQNLRDVGVAANRIEVTGNTVIDAIGLITADIDRTALLAEFGLDERGFVLATIHRPENTDDPTRMHHILSCLVESSLPVVFPVHPRTAQAIDALDFTVDLDSEALRLVEPLPYRQFLGLLAASAYAVSDSGGIQEEVTVMGTPVVVVRDSTERPEVIGTFAQRISGADGPALRAALHDLDATHPDRRASLASLTSPYAGPGGRSPAELIVDLIDLRLR